MSESQQVADYSRAVPGFIVPVIVVKSADETVNNSAALQDDDELKFYVEPYSVHRFDLFGQYDSGTTPDFKFQFTAPTGATGGLWTIGPIGGTNTPVSLPFGTPIQFDGVGAGTALSLWATGLAIIGATAGFVTLQWAQNTANASNTKVLTGSILMYWDCTPFRGKA